MRGIVLPLTQQQRLNRMLYLAKKLTIWELDEFVRVSPGTPSLCPDIYYLLKKHNGGKDPTAPDPADRWSKPGSDFVNRTCDCIGGMAWAGGWDRYQPKRFEHLYGGWINTDSMRMDAAGPRRCFVRLRKPELGCYVVFGSDPKKLVHGVPVGHIGGIIDIPDEWDERDRDCWKRLKVIDVASRTPRPANRVTTGLTWWAKDSYFVRSVMMA